MDISVLKGLGLIKVERTEVEGGDALIFTTFAPSRRFLMYHSQDCCETVRLNEVIGDLDDLVGLVVEASEETETTSDEYGDRVTWTFYKIGTTKGFVTLRWYGSSNGYYSESVDFKEIGQYTTVGIDD